MRLGWSKPELGRRLGMSTKSITRLEAGALSIDSEIIHQLEYLKHYMDELNHQNKSRPKIEKIMQENNYHQADRSIAEQGESEN